MSDPRAAAVEYIDAVGSQRFDRVSELLHPDVEFRMPGREIDGSRAYIASLRKLGPILVRNEIRTTIVEGQDVCVIYDFVTDTSVGAVPSMEWLTIEEGRIRSVWLLFHSQPWPAVLDELARRDVERVALLGWATGAHWLGYYATLHPDRVSHLILYNMLYGGSSEHSSIGPGSDLEDPERPGRFHTEAFGGYRFSTAESLFRAWDRSIPVEDKSAWRDPAVAEAYAEAALASDPTSGSRTPPSFRAPSGALEDSFYLASGRQLWDASLILAPTLILASELDFWSRPADRAALEAHLTHAPAVRVVELPQATHFVHLDRAERGRDRFLREVLAFLEPSPHPSLQ